MLSRLGFLVSSFVVIVTSSGLLDWHSDIASFLLVSMGSFRCLSWTHCGPASGESLGALLSFDVPAKALFGVP